MKVRAHLWISGLVQGVFFRHNTKQEARRLGVTGWIRNLEDGRVEVVLEGEKENVDKVIQYCRKGPPGAHVTDIELKWEDYTGKFKEFKIVYDIPNSRLTASPDV
ncbi:MAG: acylphosphatase [Candidatus Bathyarchaeia archaeon]